MIIVVIIIFKDNSFKKITLNKKYFLYVDIIFIWISYKYYKIILTIFILQ